MTARWALLSLLLLAGCVEAQERQMAQCLVEARKDLTGEQILAGRHTAAVRLCMREGGYAFDDTLAACRAAAEGYLSERAGCYEPADFFARVLHRCEVYLRALLPQ